MNTISLSLGILPLTDVTLSIQAFPDTISVLYALQPFTVIYFSILPCINAFTCRFTALISTLVGITISKNLITPTMPQVL